MGEKTNKDLVSSVPLCCALTKASPHCRAPALTASAWSAKSNKAALDCLKKKAKLRHADDILNE